MASCGCPNGYIYNPATQKCEADITQPALFTQTPAILPYNPFGVPEPNYGLNGGFFYVTNGQPLPIQETGVSFVNNLSVTLSPVATSSNLIWKNRLKNIGVFVGSSPTDPAYYLKWVGITRCINIQTSGNYTIGLAYDDFGEFSINGNIIVKGQTGTGFGFTGWYMFQVSLVAGVNIFTFKAANSGIKFALGFELYNADIVTMQTITTVPALTPIVLYSTANERPNKTASFVTDINNNFEAGYYCANGGILDVCGLTCTVRDAVDIINCCFILTECTNGGTISASGLDITLIGKVIKIEAIAGCFLVSQDPNPICNNPAIIVITDTYADCIECNKICYILTDCLGNDTLTVDNDLSAYVGQSIKIEGYDNCWIVTVATNCLNSITINLLNSFLTCEICNTPPPPPPTKAPPPSYKSPVTLKTRSLNPGYFFNNACSVEKSEKIFCTFAEAMYQKMLEKRYGIKQCCGPDYTDSLLKNKILNFNLIDDTNACKTITCCPADLLNITHTIIETAGCPPPFNVTAFLDFGCVAPNNVSATLS